MALTQHQQLSHNMSDEQRTTRHTQQFRKKFGILHQAAVGVVLVRTKEPFRAIEALRDFAFTDKMDFKLWTILNGWQTYDRSRPTEDPQMDGVVDPLAALRAIAANGPNQGQPFPETGVYVMMYPHKPLSQHIGMIQCVKEYAKSFTSGRQRLVILTPFGFSLPEELQDDVVMLDFDTPSYAELRDIYDRLIGNIPAAKRPVYSDEEIDSIIANGAGMTQQEFESALSRSLVSERPMLPNIEHGRFCQMVGDFKTEVVKRSDVLELMKPASMDDIGGLDNLKHWINQRANCFGQEARDFGIEPPKGIALIGPPGTGKSAASKAISSRLGIPLIKLDIGRVFNSLVGSSEARIREALKMVDSMAPCVLMIDEADKAFQNTSGGDSGVGMRVLGALLTWMQETSAPVFLVVTANRTANLPSEFLRKGRLDEVFNVSVPNETERLEIIKIHLRLRGKNPDDVSNLEMAVEKSAGYVSAELEAAVKDAIIEAFNTGGGAITGQLIATQFECMVPLSEAFREDFQQMEQWAADNARPASLAEGEVAGQAKPRIRNRNRSTGDGGRAMVIGDTGDSRATSLDS